MGDSSSLYNFPMRNAGNSYLKYIVFKSIKRWYVLPVYISIETNRKYLLLWGPERRTGVLPSILKTLQEVQGGIKSRNGRLSSMDNFPTGFPTNVSVEAEALSMLAHSNEDLAFDQQEGTITDLSHWLRLMIYQLGFWTPKWGRPIIIGQTGKMFHQ